MAYLLFDSGKCLLDDSPSMHDENKLRQITGSSFLSCRVQVKIWWSGTLTMRKRRVEASKESEVCSRSVWLLTCVDGRADAYLLMSLHGHGFFIETRPL